MPRPSLVRAAFNFLASVKVAIPLLVLLAAAGVLGGLIPQGANVALTSEAPGWVGQLNDYLRLNDIFHSWWYVLLLGLLGLSLLAVTVKRLPTIWRQRGRGAGLGILLAHVGVLLILGGLIYGGLSGFRYYTRAVEGEVTVLPSLPFVIKLDRLEVQYYPEDAFRHLGPNLRLAERQESTLALLQHGTAFLRAAAAPGRPLVARGVTLLPSEKDVGWVFNVVVRDPGGREKVIPVRPWAPPLIRLGLSTSRVLAHGLTSDAAAPAGSERAGRPSAAEIFLLEEDGTRRSLGFASEASPVEVYGYTISVWGIRPYVGLHVYRRPGKPFLMAALGILLVGLFEYFLRRSGLSLRGRSLGVLARSRQATADAARLPRA